MNPSKLLRRFLDSGTRPSSQREASALLDESRSLLVSKLPTTGETIMNFTAAELDSVNLKGGKVLNEMHKVYLEKQSFKPSSTPSTMKTFTSPRKTSAPPTAKPVATAPRPAPAATSKPVIHRASSTKPSTAPAPSAPAQLTAAEYATKPLVMGLAEFRKLPPADKMRFVVKSGGKIV